MPYIARDSVQNNPWCWPSVWTNESAFSTADEAFHASSMKSINKEHFQFPKHARIKFDLEKLRDTAIAIPCSDRWETSQEHLEHCPGVNRDGPEDRPDTCWTAPQPD